MAIAILILELNVRNDLALTMLASMKLSELPVSTRALTLCPSMVIGVTALDREGGLDDEAMT